MKLNEFINKKYNWKLVEQKQALREFKENEKKKKQYFALKKISKVKAEFGKKKFLWKKQ